VRAKLANRPTGWPLVSAALEFPGPAPGAPLTWPRLAPTGALAFARAADFVRSPGGPGAWHHGGRTL